MALDVTTIDTIQKARDAEYNGEKLKSSEISEIFGDETKFNTSGSFDKDKLQATCKLLDQVKRAEVLTTKTTASDTLLTELKAADKSSVAYELVNSDSNKRVEKEITHLEGLKKSDGKRDELEKEKTKKQAEIEVIEKELDKEEGKDNKEILNSLLKELEEKRRIWKNVNKVVEKSEEFLRKVWEKDSLREKVRIITDRNENYYRQLMRRKSDKDLEIYSTGLNETSRKYMRIEDFLNGFAGEYLKVLKQINVDKVLETIDNNQAFFSEVDKDELRKVFAKVKKFGFGAGTANRADDRVAYDRWATKQKFTGNTGSYVRHNIVSGFYNDGDDVDDWKHYLEDDNTNVSFEYGSLAYIIYQLFPRNTLDSNPLLNEGPYGLKAEDGTTSLLDKKFKIVYSASSSNNSLKDFKDNSRILQEDEDLVIGKAGGPTNEGIFSLWWAVFKVENEHLFAPQKIAVDHDGRERYKCQLEIDDMSRDFNGYFGLYGITDVIVELKRILEEEGVEIDGEIIKESWNDDWQRLAVDFAWEANQMSTDPSVGLQLKLDSEIAKQIEDSKNKSLEVYVSDASKERRQPPFTFYEKLDFSETFRSVFIKRAVEEITRRTEFEAVDAKVKALYKKTAELRVRKLEREKELELLIQQIKELDGLTLEEAKNKFKAIYKEGTKGGTVLGKYSHGDLILMDTYLSIIKKENGGLLDNEYSEYSQDLLNNISKHISSSYNIVYEFIGPESGKSFKERIQSMDFYNEFVDSDKQMIKDKMGEIRTHIEKIGRFRKLGDSEKLEIKNLSYYIEHGKFEGEEPPTPQKEITTAEMKLYLGNTFSDTELAEWKKVDLLKNNIEKVKELIGDYKKDGTKNSELITHLKNEPVEGEKEKIKETEDNKVWEEFVKKGPEAILKTILAHINEGLFKKDSPDEALQTKITGEMKTERDKDKGKWNKEEYGDPDKPKSITRKQWINFLYDKAIDKIKERKEKKDDNNRQETQTPLWKQYGYWGIWAPTLVIVGVLVWYFWDNISSWWSEPVEGKDEVGKEEE